MFQKILALLFLSFLFIVWGCGSNEGDPEKDDRDKPGEEQNDDDSKTGIKGLDDFVDNMKEMQENLKKEKRWKQLTSES